MAYRVKGQRLKSEDVRSNEESTDLTIIRLNSKAVNLEIKYSDLLTRIHKFVGDVEKYLEFVIPSLPDQEKERINNDIKYFFQTKDSLYTVQLFAQFKQDMTEKLFSKSFTRENFKSYINSAVNELAKGINVKENFSEKNKSFSKLESFDQMLNSSSKKYMTPVRAAKRSQSPYEKASHSYQKENTELKATLAEVMKQRDILKAWNENLMKNPNLDQVVQKIIKELREDNDLLIMKNTCLHSKITYIINSVSKFLAVSSKFQKIIREKEGYNSMNMYENEKHKLDVKLKEILPNNEGYSKNSSFTVQSPTRQIELDFKQSIKIEDISRVETRNEETQNLQVIEDELESIKERLQQEILKNELIGKENVSLKSFIHSIKSISPYETESVHEYTYENLKESNKPQRKSQSLDDIVGKLKKTVRQLKEENERLNKELEEKSSYIEKIKQDLMKAQKKIKKFHENALKSEKNNKIIKEEIIDFSKDAEKKFGEMEKLKGETANLIRKNKILSEEIEKYEKVTEKSQEENRKIKEDLENKRGLVESLKLELMKMQKENKNMQEVIEKLELFIRENKESMKEKIILDELAEERSGIQKEKQILQQYAMDFEKKVDNAKEEKKVLVKELKEKNVYIENLEVKLHKSTENFQEIIQNLEKYQAKYKEQRKITEEKSKALENLNEELIKVLNENESLHVMIKNIEKSQINEKLLRPEPRSVNSLSFSGIPPQDSIGIQTEDHDFLKSSQTSASSSPEKAQMLKELTEKAALFEILKEQLKKHQTENQNFQETIKNYENLLKQTLSEKEKLSEEIKEKSILCESVKHELHTLTRSSTRIQEHSFDKIKEESEALLQELDEKNQSLAKLKRELLTLQKTHKSLNEQLIKSEILANQIQEENLEIRQELEEQSQVIHAIDNKNKELIEMVVELRKGLLYAVSEKEYKEIEVQKIKENYRKIEFVLKSKTKLYEQHHFSSSSMKYISLKDYE